MHEWVAPSGGREACFTQSVYIPDTFTFVKPYLHDVYVSDHAACVSSLCGACDGRFDVCMRCCERSGLLGLWGCGPVSSPVIVPVRCLRAVKKVESRVESSRAGILGRLIFLASASTFWWVGVDFSREKCIFSPPPSAAAYFLKGPQAIWQANFLIYHFLNAAPRLYASCAMRAV